MNRDEGQRAGGSLVGNTGGLNGVNGGELET
jgi:hypothetical protein